MKKWIFLFVGFAVVTGMVGTSWGDETIHEAARSGDLNLVKALLSGNPEMVNVKDNLGRAPLHMAALFDHEEVFKLLLTEGAKVDAGDKRGVSRWVRFWLFIALLFALGYALRGLDELRKRGRFGLRKKKIFWLCLLGICGAGAMIIFFVIESIS